MFLLIIFILTHKTQTLDFINAIEETYPFKIDFILLFSQQKFRNGTQNSDTDPQTQTILFVQKHSVIPDSILITPTQVIYDPLWGEKYFNFSIISLNFSLTGFDLKTYFPQKNQYHKILLAYLTIVNGYGIELIFCLNSDRLISNGGKTHLWKIKKESSNLNFFAQAFISTLQLESFTNTDHFSYITHIFKTYINVTFYLSNGKLLKHQFQLLTFKREIYNSKDEIRHYILMIQQDYDISINTDKNTYKNTYNTSIIYFIGHIHSGKLNNNWGFSVNILNKDDIDFSSLSQFNTNFIKQKNQLHQPPIFNSIQKYIHDLTATASPHAVIIWFYSESCKNQSYPYLMMEQQKCYKKCPINYYDDFNKKCVKCQQCDNLQKCNSCSFCQLGNQYDIENKVCVSCSVFDQHCLHCSLIKCESCYSPYKLMENNKCLRCVDGYNFITQNSSCQLKTQAFSFHFQVYYEQNIINAIIHFDGNLNLVNQYYELQWSINSIIYYPLILQDPFENYIRAEFNLQSLQQGQYLIQIKFVLQEDNHQFLLKRQDYKILKIQKFYKQNKYYEPNFFQTFDNVVNTLSQNSGYLLSSFSIGSFMSYVVGILWYFQIASYYIFLNVSKPKRFVAFLNTTLQMQKVNLLPLSIPHPFDNTLIINNENTYLVYDIDLYFLRSNFEDIVSLIILSTVYFLMYKLLNRFKFKNFLLKKIKEKFVNQVYANISMLFYSIITVIVFTSSSSLSMTQIESKEHFMNYFTSIIGVFISFLFCALHSVFLFKLKENNNFDTEDCYVGFNREKKYSQVSFTMYLISQLIIPMVIPTFHPMFSIGVIISNSLINLIFMFKIRTIKLKISIYYRILSQISFILFNFMFIVFFIIQNYFTRIQVQFIEQLGWISVGLMLLIILLQALEMLTELIIIIIKLIRLIILKIRIISLQHPSNNLSQINNSKQINYQLQNNKISKSIKNGQIKINNHRIKRRYGQLLNHKNKRVKLQIKNLQKNINQLKNK